MDLSYRSTISIYKVSAGTEGCCCLPRGDAPLGGELFSEGGSLGWAAEGWIHPRGLGCA